jgi:hypothetical protein
MRSNAQFIIPPTRKKVALLFEIEPDKVIEFKQVNAENFD